MKFYSLVFLTLLLLISCNSEEEVCAELCGPLQSCVDGDCVCPEAYYQMGRICSEKRPNDFFGKLECGCLDEMVLNTAGLQQDRLGFRADFGSGLISPVTALDDGSYQASMQKGCSFDDGVSFFVDFTLKEINENELHVHARWWNLEVGALEECESIFVH